MLGASSRLSVFLAWRTGSRWENNGLTGNTWWHDRQRVGRLKTGRDVLWDTWRNWNVCLTLKMLAEMTSWWGLSLSASSSAASLVAAYTTANQSINVHVRRWFTTASYARSAACQCTEGRAVYHWYRCWMPPTFSHALARILTRTYCRQIAADSLAP